MFFREGKDSNSFELKLEIESIIQEFSYKDAYDIRKQTILDEENITIPCSVFRCGLSGLEAIIKYLKEEKKLTYAEIAKILGRDPRTIWTTYNKTKIKYKQQKTQQKNKKTNTKTSQKQTSFSTKIIQKRDLSVLEAVAVYLKDVGLSLKEISDELGRDSKTIWTVLKRAEKKTRSEVQQ